MFQTGKPPQAGLSRMPLRQSAAASAPTSISLCKPYAKRRRFFQRGQAARAGIPQGCDADRIQAGDSRTVCRECLWRACTAGKNSRFTPLLRSPVLDDRISGRVAMVACHGQAGQIPGGCRPAGAGNPLEFLGDRRQPRCSRVATPPDLAGERERHRWLDVQAEDGLPSALAPLGHPGQLQLVLS